MYDKQERVVYYATASSTGSIDSAGTVGYSYYDNGSLHTVSSNGSLWTYAYNSNDRLVSEKLHFAGRQFTLSYQYDDELNLSRITYPSGEQVDYTYNGFGEQRSATGWVSEASYHPSGALASMTLASGEVYATVEDGRKRIQDIYVAQKDTSVNASYPLELSYAYTDRSNVKSIGGYFNKGRGARVALTGLAYDGLSRLHSASGGWEGVNARARFSYDVWGNIDRRSVGGVNLEYDYDTQSNVLRSASFSGGTWLNQNRDYTYDGNGNVTSDGVKDYRYDHLNRLLQVKIDNTTVQTHSYDAHGHRTRTILADGQRTRTTFYVYSASGTLLHEFDLHTEEQRDHIQFNGRTIATKIFHENHDSDGDGLPDYYERLYGFSIYRRGDQDKDHDGDGVKTLDEFRAGLSPYDVDTDGDGISDSTQIGGVFNPGGLGGRIRIEPVINHLLF